MAQRFKIGDRVILTHLLDRAGMVRIHTDDPAISIPNEEFGKEFEISEITRQRINCYVVQPVEHKGPHCERRWTVPDEMLEAAWVEVPDGTRYRVQFGGQSFIRSFKRGWTPQQLAEALVTGQKGTVQLAASMHDSLIVGEFEGNPFTLLRMN